MPRTIIDIPDDQIHALDQLRKQQHVTRAALVREAISAYLTNHHAGLAEEAFGILRDKPIDALSHQQKLRSEWSS